MQSHAPRLDGLTILASTHYMAVGSQARFGELRLITSQRLNGASGPVELGNDDTGWWTLVGMAMHCKQLGNAPRDIGAKAS